MSKPADNPVPPSIGRLAKLRARLKGQSFVRQVLTLMTGTIGGQLILFAVSPLLTRIFTPADFATFALFAATSNVFAVVLPGRYDFAIMLEEDDLRALHVALAALGLTWVGTALLQAGALTLGPEVLSALEVPDEQGWLLYFPLGAGLWASFDIINRWHSREKLFGRMAAATASYSFAMASSQIAVIMMIPGLRGLALIVGQLLGRFTALIVLIRAFSHQVRTHRDDIHLSEMRAALKRHWRFPAFSVPSGLLSRLRNSLPAFMIPFFGANVLGWFALCNRVLASPITLMGGAVSQVFFPRIAEIRNDPKKTRTLLIRAYSILGIMMIPPVVILLLWAEPIFGWVFGEEWTEAGRYAQLLVPLMVIRFIVAPTGHSMQAFERQFEVLVWIVVYLGVTFSALYWGTRYTNPATTISVYAWSSAGMYLVYLIMSLYFSAHPKTRDEEDSPSD